MKSGIYRITCLKNGKFYIGSSVDLNNRWSCHLMKLNKNIHYSKYLQHSWNKYGKEYFDFDIIEYCEINSLIEREQYYINYMQPQFNTNPIAGSNLGKKCTKETRRKHSIIMMNNTYSKGVKHNRRKKFPDEYIREIRASKLNYGELAREYSCSRGEIFNIKRFVTYKNII